MERKEMIIDPHNIAILDQARASVDEKYELFRKEYLKVAKEYGHGDLAIIKTTGIILMDLLREYPETNSAIAANLIGIAIRAIYESEKNW